MVSDARLIDYASTITLNGLVLHTCNDKSYNRIKTHTHTDNDDEFNAFFEYNRTFIVQFLGQLRYVILPCVPKICNLFMFSDIRSGLAL